jgi:aminomethyltransferase
MSDGLRTPLHDRHLALGARMAPFAGWLMPIQYHGVREEHRAVRTGCGVFDVSHMGQIVVAGGGAAKFLQATLTNDVAALDVGQGQYTLVCRPDGGVIDDLIVYRTDELDFLIVCNASNIAPVAAWIDRQASGLAEVVVADNSGGYAMLAVQGSEWEAALAPMVDDGWDTILGLAYFSVTRAQVAGVGCLVARTGYTGEPGVEIMCPTDRVIDVWDALLAGPAAPVPAGLAARDTLRLEMGYPLYGQELSLERTPIEAGLRWACALDTDFVGSEVMRRQVAEGTAERLCMFELTEPGIPRAGCGVLHDGTPVGTVTSGTLSPSLDVGFGMAYVPTGLAVPDTTLTIDIRGKQKAAHTRPRPLVDTSPKRSD